ncbi:MAG: CDP-glycerol glycerophosphotransferase family protein [Acidaminococcaceae bacterium]|nr:CDP-glycerol glycerophosphotransferase family protein [Acidaminococcaceae bacterium]MBQ5345116.1 CDP-glycerol glycerophosphotransferase family protein [Acidaminococcaceae bacterium]
MFTRIKDIAHITLFHFRQIKASYYLKRIKRNKIANGSRKIKVGFLVQMQEIWDKQAPVYEKLNLDERFIVSLIVVPPRDFCKSSYSFEEYEKLLFFFTKKYPMADIQKAYDKHWLDLSSMGFDYIFYPRCWEKDLPPEYRTGEIIKYAKTCYIPYGAGGFRYDKSFYYKRSFFISLYINFCNSKERVSLFPKGPYKHNIFLGTPLIDYSITRQQSITANSKSILWTPRWTDEEIYGGTTFFVYKDKMLTLKTKYPSIDLVLRPHPSTFKNALFLGKMTESEIEEYKNRVKEHGASFDKNEMVGDSFRQTGILITDYSSIILEFFLSGKPVIYCGKTNINFDEIYERIFPGFYIAENWEQVESAVQKLLNGEDDLKTIRMNIIEDIKKQHIGATERIVNFLIKDAYYQ